MKKSMASYWGLLYNFIEPCEFDVKRFEECGVDSVSALTQATNRL